MYGGSGTSPTSSSRSRASAPVVSTRSTWNVSPAAVRAPTTSTGRPSAVEQLLAVAQLAGRAHERLPVAPARVLRLEQQHLGLAAGRPLQPQAGRDHLRLVDDDDVAGPEQVGQVGDGAVLGRRAPPVDEQAGGVAGLDRDLGDALGRQLVVEVVEAHGAARYGSASITGRDAHATSR